MKKLSSSLLALSLCAASVPAFATDIGAGLDLSANVGATSDYVWRGMSQSENKMAVMGGVDLAHESGFYLGTWLSTVEFYFVEDAHTEWDMYGGYKFSLGDTAIDLKYIKYNYPGANALNFSEYHLGVSYANPDNAYLNITASLDYSTDTPLTDPNTGGVDDNTAFHQSLAYALPLPYELTLTPTVGRYDYEDRVVGNEQDYTYYGAALTRSWLGMNWSLAWTDTNLSSKDCEAFAGNKSYCDSITSLTVVKAF